ncbi:MAG: DUF1653 domain-containing protein [Filifactoraceae bacterium]
MNKGKYIHFKGNEYELLYIAKHSETLESMAVYRAIKGDGEIWVRPLNMWNEDVEHNGSITKRFRYIGEEK